MLNKFSHQVLHILGITVRGSMYDWVTRAVHREKLWIRIRYVKIAPLAAICVQLGELLE